MNRFSKSGFTLIELSIVLVVIGLIVGGVLVGRELVHSAEIRGAVSEMQKLNAALSTFEFKYNALAGDIADATSHDLATNCDAFGNSGNGNGDGILNYSVASGTNAMEDRKVFCHLYNAKLWPFNNLVGGTLGGHNCWNSDCNNIPSSVGKSYMVSAIAAWNGQLTTYAAASGFYFFYSDTTDNYAHPSFTSGEAKDIDTKMDDGLPTSGDVQAWNSYDAPTVGATGSANCLDNSASPYIYNTTYKTTTVCTLGFKMPDYK